MADAYCDQLIEHSPLGIMVARSDGLVERVNAAALALFGEERADELVGRLNVRTDAAFGGEAWAPCVERAYAGEVQHVPPVEMLLGRSVARTIRATLIPVTAGGTAGPVICVMEDLTELAASKASLDHRFQHAESLQDAFQRIAEEADPDRVADRILDALGSIWEDPCALWLGVPGQPGWHCAAWRGLSDEYIRRAEDYYRVTPPEKTLAGAMMRERGPVAVDDLFTSPLTRELSEEIVALGLRRLMVVTMRTQGAVTGALALYGRLPGPFDAADLETANLLGSQAAVALHNARLFAEMEAIQRGLEERVRERTEEVERVHAESMANERLAAVGFMAREVAHGLRNPLNVISASNFYVRSRFKDADEKVQRHLDTIDRYVEQAANIITQLMNLAGSRSPEMAPLDLNELVSRAVQERFTARNVPIEAEWGPDPLMVNGDWLQLSHVVKALVANAVSDTEGGVYVRTCRDDGHAVVSVGDRRHEATAEEREGRFDAFYASSTQWTGLGLSVARGIARKHGGDVVDAEEDGITWFRLRLPLLAG